MGNLLNSDRSVTMSMSRSRRKRIPIDSIGISTLELLPADPSSVFSELSSEREPDGIFGSGNKA
jgi:hypothetical protein